MGFANVQRCRDWFSSYCAAFYTGEREHDRNIRLKEEHTERVRRNAAEIAAGMGLDGRDAARAEIVALFHDVGRFPQYRDHRTFRDSESVNHASLGAKVLLEHRVLRDLAKDDRDLVVRAVALHNVFSLPDGLDRPTGLHARLVRDADKLDIWRIFGEVFALPEAERPSAAGLGLPETPDYSPEVLKPLQDRRMVRLAGLASLNDFKLLQLAWIYDLNYLPSFRMVKERGIIGRLAATLPKDAALARSLDGLRKHVEERIAALSEEQDRTGRTSGAS